MNDQQMMNAPQQNATVFVVLGWVFTVLTPFTISFLFGPAAIIMGILAIRRGARTQGKWIIIVSAILLVLSLILGGLAAAWLIKNMPSVPR